MGRGLVALVALLALSGCTVVAVPDPGLSNAERDVIQKRVSDGYWAESGLPDEQRPTGVPVAVVPGEEWLTLFVRCMNDSGFDSYQVEADGVSSFVSDDPNSEPEALARYICRTSYWTDAGWNNSARMDYVYDYYEQNLVPCLTVLGVELVDAPNRQEFFDQFGGWNPYLSITQSAHDRVFNDQRVLRDCPPMPPGMEDTGYSALWN